MNTKRLSAIAFILMMTLSMLTACGGNGGAPAGSGSTTNPPAATPGETPNAKTHNCPCDPECTNKECEDGDKCKCGADEAYPPLTFDIEIETALSDDECNYDGCGMDTLGKATVTMNYIDSKTGYSGSAEGSGVTTKNGTHEMAVKYTVAYGDLPDYAFTVRLSMPSNDKTYIGVGENYQTVLVGVDKLGPDEATIDWTPWGGGLETGPSFLSFIQQGFLEDAGPSDVGTAYPDMDTGLLTFEMPLMNEPICVLFAWGEVLNIYITLTLMD